MRTSSLPSWSACWIFHRADEICEQNLCSSSGCVLTMRRSRRLKDLCESYVYAKKKNPSLHRIQVLNLRLDLVSGGLNVFVEQSQPVRSISSTWLVNQAGILYSQISSRASLINGVENGAENTIPYLNPSKYLWPLPTCVCVCVVGGYFWAI